jgi:hypothetical protein
MAPGAVALSYPLDMVLELCADGLRIFGALLGNHGQIVNLILIVSLQVLQRFSKGHSNFGHFIVLVRHYGRTVVSMEMKKEIG